MDDDHQDTCCAKVGDPFRMRECGLPVEFVKAGDLVYGGLAKAVHTGFYHTVSGETHFAVSRRWTT